LQEAKVRTSLATEKRAVDNVFHEQNQKVTHFIDQNMKQYAAEFKAQNPDVPKHEFEKVIQNAYNMTALEVYFDKYLELSNVYKNNKDLPKVNRDALKKTLIHYMDEIHTYNNISSLPLDDVEKKRLTDATPPDLANELKKRGEDHAEYERQMKELEEEFKAKEEKEKIRKEHKQKKITRTMNDFSHSISEIKAKMHHRKPNPPSTAFATDATDLDAQSLTERVSKAKEGNLKKMEDARDIIASSDWSIKDKNEAFNKLSRRGNVLFAESLLIKDKKGLIKKAAGIPEDIGGKGPAGPSDKVVFLPKKYGN